MKKSIHTFNVKYVDTEFARIYFPAWVTIYDDETIRIVIDDGALPEIAVDAIETHQVGMSERIEDLEQTLEAVEKHL